MSMLESRRRLIGQFGRTMRLRRPVAGGQMLVVTLKAFSARYAPGEIEGAIQQGDERIEILHDEISAAGWTSVNNGDWLMKDGKQVTVQGANPVFEGSQIIGHTLWVRG